METDLYLRGKNSGKLVKAGKNAQFNLVFESGQITANFSGMSGYLATSTTHNLTGYNGIGCEGYSLRGTDISIYINTENGDF